MPRTTKKPQKAVYLPAELIERVRQSADKNRRSWNAEVQVALEFYLEQQEKGSKRGEVDI
jgi:hypothetical protein